MRTATAFVSAATMIVAAARATQSNERPIGGPVPGAAVARITGSPASAEFVAQAAVRAALAAASARSDARASLAAAPGHAPALLPNHEAFVDVPVAVAGTDGRTARGTTRVRVEDVAVPHSAATTLFVSTATRAGHADPLLTVPLSGDAVRVFWSYANSTGVAHVRVALVAQNLGREPATLHVISGAGEADRSAPASGHAAAHRFLVHLLQYEGALETIAPGDSRTIVDADVPQASAAAAIVQVRQLTGGRARLTLSASSHHERPQRTTQQAPDRVGSAEAYTPADLSTERTYEIPGPDTVVSIGQIAVSNAGGGPPLAGDYGVRNDVTIRMRNDTAEPAQIALYANPRGGTAAGTFVIDGTVTQVRPMAAFSTHKLREYAIPAGGYVTTHVVTMPEAGSAYPLNLVVAPDDGSPAPGAPGSLVD